MFSWNIRNNNNNTTIVRNTMACLTRIYTKEGKKLESKVNSHLILIANIIIIVVVRRASSSQFLYSTDMYANISMIGVVVLLFFLLHLLSSLICVDLNWLAVNVCVWVNVCVCIVLKRYKRRRVLNLTFLCLLSFVLLAVLFWLDHLLKNFTTVCVCVLEEPKN